MRVSSRSNVEHGNGSRVRAFLIADIRDYATFTREQGEEEAAALVARFVELAGDSVEVSGGRIAEIRGDQVLAVDRRSFCIRFG